MRALQPCPPSQPLPSQSLRRGRTSPILACSKCNKTDQDKQPPNLPRRTLLSISPLPLLAMGRCPAYDKYFATSMAEEMKNYEKAIAPVKRQLFVDHLPTSSGARILELGIGTGPNLQYFSEGGPEIIGVDPNPEMLVYARQEASRLGLRLTAEEGAAEALPLPDASVDAVISTLVFCSLPQPEAALQEVKRVLKPGGAFIFIEHVLDPKPGLRPVLQRVFNPLQRLLADGCNLDRDTLGRIEGSGFSRVEARRFEVESPGAYFIAPHVAGAAYVR